MATQLPATTSAPFFSDDDKRLIKKYLLGGVLAGGGTALLTSYANYLGNIKRRATSDDDKELHIRLKRGDNGAKKASLRGAAAVTAGTVGTILAYAAMKGAYKKLQKSQVQKDLDEAQVTTLNLQGYEPSKKASTKPPAGKPMGLTETVGGLGLALPLLLALASGAVAYKGLDKAFPVEKIKVPKVRKVVIEEEDPKKEKRIVKLASDDGFEFLYRLMDTVPESLITKMASHIACAGSDVFVKKASSAGFYSALDSMSISPGNEVDEISRHLAISFLTKSASVQEQTRLAVCSDFQDKFPLFYKLAAALEPEVQESLFDFACLLGATTRSEIFEPWCGNISEEELSKSSATITDTVTEKGLDALISGLRKKRDPEKEVPTEMISNDVAETELSGDGERKTITARGKEAQRFADKNKDVIDSLLSA